MAKKAKKLFTCLFVFILLALVPMQVFGAQTRATGTVYQSYANTNYILNAATDGTPVNGTNVTVWTHTNHDTQKWTEVVSWSSPTLYSIRSVANQNVCLTNSGSNCVLGTYSSNNRSTQGIHLSPNTSNSLGLVLYVPLLAVTATRFSSGGNVAFSAPNGSNAQLWYWWIAA